MRQDHHFGQRLSAAALVFLICLITSIQTAVAEVDSPPLFIHTLKLVGNKSVSSDTIYAELLTPRPPFFFWRSLPHYNPEDLRNDINRLKALYRREGFYHASISPEVQESDGRVDIRLAIQEGPGIQVIKIEISVVETDSQIQAKTLLKFSPLVLGQRFTESDFEKIKKEILNHLLDNGYPKGRVEGEVLLDPKANTAAVYIQVWPGPVCSFGRITIKGQQDTPEPLIQRYLKVKPGERFSLAKIIASQERLYELDLFQSVLIEPEEVPAHQREIPITVVVSEKKKRSLKIGAGYGSWDEFRARAILRYRNLVGGGRVLEMNSKYSRLETRFEGSFLNPRIVGTDLDLVVTSGLLWRYYPTFSDRALFTRAVLEKELPWKTKAYFGHGLEFARPYGISDLALQLLTATQPGQLYRANMLVWGLSRSSIDNPADPQEGGQVYLVGEWAPRFMSGQLQFVQSSLDVRQFQNLGLKNVVLAARAKFGLIPPIQNTDQIPIYRRFFSGGPTNMRAYRMYYLGPRDSSGNPLGGESIFLSTLELRFPMYQEFRGVAFFDAGNVFSRLEDTDMGQLKYGAGFGLRYQTPIGPIGVEFAWPLNPIDRDKDTYQVILNIGHAF